MRRLPFILCLLLTLGLAPAQTPQQTLQRAIDGGAQTSGVVGVPLGVEIPLASGVIDLKGVPLKVFPGTVLRGHGASTVLIGDIVIETRTSPDNYYAESIVIERFQLKGNILRGKTAVNEADNIQIRDVEMFGGAIDLRGKAINRLTLERVGFHSWRGTTVMGHFRISRIVGCKWLSEDVDVNSYPLVELFGDQNQVSFNDNWIQPRGLFLRAIGNSNVINYAANWVEPLPPRDEQLRREQITVLPQLIMDGNQSVLIADRLVSQDVQPMIFRNGAHWQCGNVRATDTFGAELPADRFNIAYRSQ